MVRSVCHRLGSGFFTGKGEFQKGSFPSCLSSTSLTMKPFPIFHLVPSPISLLIFLLYLFSLINSLWWCGEILKYTLLDPLEQIYFQCLLPAWQCTEGLRRGTQKKKVYERTHLPSRKKKGIQFGINFMPYKSPALIGEIRHTPINQPGKFYLMRKTAQFNRKRIGFRGLGSNLGYINYCVVLNKFF